MSKHEEIKKILEKDFGLDLLGINDDTKLFSSGLLDSLSSLNLLMSLESNFGIKISPLDISYEDIDSIDCIVRTVARITE